MKRDLEKKVAQEMVNGKHFRVGTYKDGFRSNFIVKEDGAIVGEGIAFEVLNYLSTEFNFTYEIVLPQNYSKIRDNKIMQSLLVEMLLERKIDIAAAFITWTKKRRVLVVVDYVLDTINCLTSLDDAFRTTTDIVNYKRSLEHSQLQPFNADVWYVFLATLTLYVTCFVLLTRLRSKLIADDEKPYTIWSCLSFAYKELIGQNLQQTTKTSMTRILLITWSVFARLMGIFYAAHLSKGYTLTAVSQGDTIKTNLKWLQDSGVEVDITNFFTCHNKMAIDYYMKRPSGFAYPKNSSLNILFGSKIRRLYYTGFMHVVHSLYKKLSRKICPDVLRSNEHSLTVDDMAALYYSGMIGTVAAVAVFLVEVKRCSQLFELILNIFTKPKPLPSEDSVEDVSRQDFVPPTTTEPSHQLTTSRFQWRIVNGRRYLMARTRDGDVRLIPVHTLSALLYNLDLYKKK